MYYLYVHIYIPIHIYHQNQPFRCWYIYPGSSHGKISSSLGTSFFFRPSKTPRRRRRLWSKKWFGRFGRDVGPRWVTSFGFCFPQRIDPWDDCIYGGFLKWWYPLNHPWINRVFHYKPSILGYPYFWKHPYIFLHEFGWFSYKRPL